MSSEQFTPRFARELRKNGIYPIANDSIEIGIPVAQILRAYGNYTDLEIKRGIRSEIRDIFFPKVKRAIDEVLKPWKKLDVGKELPTITFLELSRMTGLSPSKLIRVLQENQLTLEIDDIFYDAKLYLPDYPKDPQTNKDKPLTIKDGTTYGISPKRLIRLAQYESRAPGGGPVQKVRIQERKVDGILRPIAQKKGYIKFVAQKQDDQNGSISGLPINSLQLYNNQTESISNVAGSFDGVFLCMKEP